MAVVDARFILGPIGDVFWSYIRRPDVLEHQAGQIRAAIDLRELLDLEPDKVHAIRARLYE